MYSSDSPAGSALEFQLKTKMSQIYKSLFGGWGKSCNPETSMNLMFKIERFVIDLVALSTVLQISLRIAVHWKYLIYGRGMFRWLGARTVLLSGGIVNQYAQFLTADLSYVTGGTKPDNQAEEEEDWEEGGVVQWHCRQWAPGKKVFKVWVHLIYQHTLKSNHCSCYFSMSLLNAVEKCCHSRDCVHFSKNRVKRVKNSPISPIKLAHLRNPVRGKKRQHPATLTDKRKENGTEWNRTFRWKVTILEHLS